VPRGPVAWVIAVLGAVDAFGLAGLGAVTGCGHPAGPAIDAPMGIPDLQFVAAEMTQSVLITRNDFLPDACEVVESCVGAPGGRTLLRFDTVSANRGTADLVVGVPPPPGESNDVFEWSPCHMHHHVRNYASYELLDATGTVVLTARKQSFCLEDDENIQPGVPPTGYSCTDQGITRGWADVYSRYLPCQWIDITDVAAGTYTLRVVANPLRTLRESNYDNNTFTVLVHF
jgi:hypothetical protein